MSASLHSNGSCATGEAVAPRPRLDSLTSLRWFAALGVWVVHAQFLFIRSMPRVVRYMNGGSLGVSFFFILSGFILTWTWRRNDGTVGFYRRRFARVYPNFLVSFLATCLLIVYFGGPTPIGPAIAQLMLVQSFVPRANYYLSYAIVTWSLSCEAFFYALFPLLINIGDRLSARVRRLLLAATGVAAMALPLAVGPIVYGSRHYWLLGIAPPVRLAEFVIGMGLGLEMRAGWRLSVAVTPVLATSLLAMVAAAWAPGQLDLVAITLVPFTLLIAAAASRDLRERRTFLQARPLIALGEVSFAFYLTHAFVNLAFGLLRYHAGNLMSDLLVAAGLLACSIAAAFALNRWVERPLERRLRGAQPPHAEAPGSVVPVA